MNEVLGILGAVFGLLGILLRLLRTRVLFESIERLRVFWYELHEVRAVLISRWRERTGKARVAGNSRQRLQLRIPSLSQGLVSLAERRLPEQMAATEKQRWGQEMRADVAWQPRRKRLWVAFNAWRKAAQMPAGAEGAARSARD